MTRQHRAQNRECTAQQHDRSIVWDPDVQCRVLDISMGGQLRTVSQLHRSPADCGASAVAVWSRPHCARSAAKASSYRKFIVDPAGQAPLRWREQLL